MLRNFTVALLIPVVFLMCAGAFATSQCPVGATCAPLPEGYAVAVAAQIVAAKNVCSRLDPAQEARYADAIERVIGNERDAFRAAMDSPLFPSHLQAMEAELGAKPAAKLQRDCAELLRRQ